MMVFNICAVQRLGFLLFLVGIMATSCQQEKEYIPEVAPLGAPIQIRRFEQDFFSLDSHKVYTQLPAIREKYGEFSNILFGPILHTDDSLRVPEGPEAFLGGMVQHPTIRQLYDTTQLVFKDFSKEEKELTDALAFFKHYFPNRPLPDFTTFISEYSISNFLYDEQSLAIGLDFFLGAQYPYERFNPDNPNFSSYLTRTNNKDHLAMKSMRPLIDDMVGPVQGSTMLDHMIREGKIMYILDKILPYEADTVITEYSPAQLDWVQGNAQQIYAHFMEQSLFYSTNYKDFQKHVTYSPNAPGMPQEAPGRTGVWMGWQIIRAYMRMHPKTTMEDLLTLNDSKLILQKAKYRP